MTQQELIDLTHQQATTKEQIHKAKRSANKELRKEHKILLRVFDVVFVLMILANVGALVLTNMLVMKANPTQELTELNPIAAEQYEFVSALDVHPVQLVWGAIIGAYFHILAYFGMTLIWLYFRFFSNNRKKLYQGMMLLTFWGSALFMDFFNNFGLWIGRTIWG